MLLNSSYHCYVWLSTCKIGDRRRLVLLVPSAGPYIRSDNWELLHLQGSLHRILARGMSYFSFCSSRYIWSIIPLIADQDLISCKFRVHGTKQDVRYLMDDIQELKPTIFCGVPRVYDRIYAGLILMLIDIFLSVSSANRINNNHEISVNWRYQS